MVRRGGPGHARVVIGCLAIASSGCALLTPTSSQVPQPEWSPEQAQSTAASSASTIGTPAELRAPRNALDDGYYSVTGVMHIHTRYSDGTGTFKEIERIANRERLDYIVVTDHNTLQPLRDGHQGWHGRTLVLIGTELSTRAGHFLALNIHDDISCNQPTQAIIDEVNRQGGLGFIAHPYFKRRRWTDWTVHGFTGIEGYNTAHDVFDENRLRLALWAMALPPESLYLSIVDRPYDALSKWDALAEQRGPIVGIGSSDAHGVKVLGLNVAPYDISFKLVRTHVLLPAGVALTEPRFYDALRAGHAYFSIDLITASNGFAFFAVDEQRVAGIMGDTIDFKPGLQLITKTPALARLMLYRNGLMVSSSSGRFWRVPITEPGIYRLEANRHGKPWIFSNPIYVRNKAVATQAEQHDATTER